MASKWNTAKFVEEAKKVHGDRYDYSLVKYKGIKQNVWIVCSEHGKFLQRPDIHLRGLGCPKCGIEKKNAKYTTEWFIEKANKVHGDRYDYSATEYMGNKLKVVIKCPVHGRFEQVAGDHLRGNGCPECAKSATMTNKEFLKRAVAKHGDKYNYIKTHYVNNKTKVKIICPKHGEFEQRADCHLSGQGCPQCAIEERLKRPGGYGSGRKSVKTMAPRKIRVKYDIEVLEKLKSRLYSHLSKGYKGEILKNQSLNYGTIDFLIPEFNIGIIIYSSYVCSESYYYNYSDAKPLSYYRLTPKKIFNECNEKGLFVYSFYEDEVNNKFDLIVSMIRNKMGLGNGYREYARKCSIVRLDKNSANEFYNENHIQGLVTGKIHYGLCNPDDELVSVMSFNHIVSNRGVKSSNKEWELVRFASYGSIVGGASKLLKHFIDKHPKCKSIVSYSDNRISNGALYETLGFKLDHDVNPNYYYIENGGEDGNRYSKQKFKKANEERLWSDFNGELTEIENAANHGYFRIWDAGKKKWRLDIKN